MWFFYLNIATLKIPRVKILAPFIYLKVLTFDYHWKISPFFAYFIRHMGFLVKELNYFLLSSIYLSQIVEFRLIKKIVCGSINMCKQKFWKGWTNKWTSHFTRKFKHLWGYWTFETNLFNTSDLPNHTKLAYNYNLKKPCKKKPLQLDCGKWIKHINKIETKLFGL